MSILFYLQASPRIGRSHSIAVADAFVKAYKENHPHDEIITRNLFRMHLPAFDGLAVSAKYSILHGKHHSEEELKAWEDVEAVINEFKSADKYVVAVPMWNFSIPYRLKQYIDLLVQPGYTFSYTAEEGYKGMITDKPILIVCARGGQYPPGGDAESIDFQTKYLHFILGFMGFNDIRTVLVEPTLEEGPEVARKKRENAIVGAVEMACTF
ncbi:MAG: NAD(P)H-dependent oxidoreductase [Deltaproteobacteria bacterium]|nr:NAD(P)H-dependent oxidoreductase [Deltaproteobacteria bacterium]